MIERFIVVDLFICELEVGIFCILLCLIIYLSFLGESLNCWYELSNLLGYCLE